MFQRIVVPLDGSSIASQAIPYASQIAEPGAKITLVGVVEPPMDAFFASGSAAQAMEQMEFSREILAREAEVEAGRLRAMGFHVTTSVPTGIVTDAIIGCAHDVHADVIVMTTHGTGGVSRWLLGSITNRVLHTTQIPVLVVRATAASAARLGVIDGILVPVDGAALSASAIETAKSIAKRFALPLRFVRVVDDETSILPVAPLNDYEAARRLTQALVNARAHAELFIDQIVALTCASGVDASGSVLAGSPAATLLRHFAEHPNALVVIATHGEGSAQQWAFGSVAEKIITTAMNPTLVLRPAIRHIVQHATTHAESALA